jgi:hypothetical protein
MYISFIVVKYHLFLLIINYLMPFKDLYKNIYRLPHLLKKNQNIIIQPKVSILV